MVRLGRHSNPLSAYAQLSMWERQVLKIWITDHVDLHMIWHYTSLGIAEQFKNSPLGFVITHGQLQQAMLNAGFTLYASEGDVWIFDAAWIVEVEDR
jgi:hypothetical protein